MENGFAVLGHSAPASAANYDEKVGETYAYENAFKQLWQLEGYLLREKLYAKAHQPKPKPPKPEYGGLLRLAKKIMSICAMPSSLMGWARPRRRPRPPKSTMPAARRA